MKGQFSLLGERRFGPFFLTQFLGAFNDNVYKNALIILIAFQLASGNDANLLINFAAGLFIIPFFLFSATAGQIADKYEKSRLIRLVKLGEVIIMLCAAVALATRSIWALMALLFLMGAQSSLFGPVKYGILPQQLAKDELVGGNGLVEMGTFLAILLGTMLGGILIGMRDIGTWLVGGCVVSIAVLGYLASLRIPEAPPTAPNLEINWNAWTETWRNLGYLRGQRSIYLSVLGIAWFWFYGATYLTQLPNYTRITLGGNEQVVTLLLTLFSVGVGIGSLACERLSDRKVELGLVPLGSIGLTAFAIDLYFAAPGHAGPALMTAGEFLKSAGNLRVMWDVVLLGFSGGIYIVPLYALIQSQAEPAHRSRVIAGNNILNSLFMVVAAILAAVLLGQGLSIAQLFLLTAILNAVVAIYIYSLVPEFLVRFLAWMLIHTIYRVKKSGLEQIPDEGPAILVCNHVSFVDALILGGCVRRPTRFVMYHKIFDTPVISWFFRTVKAIPIAPAKEDPELLERALAVVSAELRAGHLVCVFPEGGLTDNGDIKPFRKGFERMLANDPVPVVPMALCGLWGSFFSRKRGAAMQSLPRRFWSRIELKVGAPVPAEEATAQRLEQAVRDLRAERA